MTQTLTAILSDAAGTVQMTIWAKKKHCGIQETVC